jgi:hypothetical protein
MHGTWVNGAKLPQGGNVRVDHGDILTFGTKVTRGPGMPICDFLL